MALPWSPTANQERPRSDGPRTTLRVPDSLVISAERLAGELGISRNDALLRLATRGADLYETERLIEKRREERWESGGSGEIEPESASPRQRNCRSGPSRL